MLHLLLHLLPQLLPPLRRKLVAQNIIAQLRQTDPDLRIRARFLDTERRVRSQAVKCVLRKLLGPVLRLAAICNGRARVKPAGAQQHYPDKLPNMSFQREAEPSSEGACER